MSLRLRLIAAIGLVLLATLAVGSLLIYRHMLAKVDVEMRAAIAVGERITAGALTEGDAAAPGRAEQFDRIVARFDGDRHIRASLVASDGAVMRQSRLAPPEERAPDWLTALLWHDPVRSQIKIDDFAAQGLQFVLETDPANEIGEAWRDMKLYFGLLLLFSGLVMALSHLILGRALQPIEDLKRGFHGIGTGDYTTRIGVPAAPPELHALCDGFNTMGAKLEGMRIKNTELSQHLDKVQEEERTDLARNLHDEVSPLLFSVDVDATIIRDAGAGLGDGVIAERAEAIRRAAAEMKRHVKVILSQLRPSMIEQLGFHSALETLKSTWHARHPKVAFDVDLPAETLPRHLKSTLYYVIRESVSNALKHGEPKRIAVKLDIGHEGGAFLTITDDGGGPRDGNLRAGFGVTGMTERVEKLAGRLTIRHDPAARGMIVEAKIPPLADEGRNALSGGAEAA